MCDVDVYVVLIYSISHVQTALYFVLHVESQGPTFSSQERTMSSPVGDFYGSLFALSFLKYFDLLVGQQT